MRSTLHPVEQAGGVVVGGDPDRITVLLVRAKKNPSLWIFPKGHIERGETAAEAALREVREEAGVEGELIGPVGEPLEFHSGKEFVRVEYFLIRAQREWPETDGREKRWFDVDDALAAITFDNTRAVLRDAISALRRRSTQAGR